MGSGSKRWAQEEGAERRKRLASKRKRRTAAEVLESRILRLCRVSGYHKPPEVRSFSSVGGSAERSS